MKDDDVIYYNPQAPHPWANKTAEEILADMNKLFDEILRTGPTPIPFQDLPDPAEAAIPTMRQLKCDCGAEKAKTPHVDWCTLRGGR